MSPAIYSQGRYEEGEPLCQRALRISEAAFGTKHPSVASTLNNQALLLQLQVQQESLENRKSTLAVDVSLRNINSQELLKKRVMTAIPFVAVLFELSNILCW